MSAVILPFPGVTRTYLTVRELAGKQQVQLVTKPTESADEDRAVLAWFYDGRQASAYAAKEAAARSLPFLTECEEGASAVEVDSGPFSPDASAPKPSASDDREMLLGKLALALDVLKPFSVAARAARGGEFSDIYETAAAGLITVRDLRRARVAAEILNLEIKR